MRGPVWEQPPYEGVLAVASLNVIATVLFHQGCSTVKLTRGRGSPGRLRQTPVSPAMKVIARASRILAKSQGGLCWFAGRWFCPGRDCHIRRGPALIVERHTVLLEP